MPDKENKRVKLIDIAAKTGFTVGTISKALQNKEGIARETRETILRAANEIGYIANAQAGGLRSGSTKTVAIIISDIANPLFAIEIKTCVAMLYEQGYSAIVIDTDECAEREEQAVISALSKNVDGVLLCPTQHSTRALELLNQNGMPFVLLGRRFADADANYVVWGDEQGGYLAGRHLAELGHRRILTITANPRISSASERMRGFGRAMAEAGIEIDPALVRLADATAHDAMRIIEDVLRERLRFTAILAFSDYIAWEVIYTLNQHGVRVPEDVSIVGFDDVQSHMCFPPPLTSIHAPKQAMAQETVGLLMRLIQNGGDRCTHITLNTKLVVRGSAGAPPETMIADRPAVL